MFIRQFVRIWKPEGKMFKQPQLKIDWLICGYSALNTVLVMIKNQKSKMEWACQKAEDIECSIQQDV